MNRTRFLVLVPLVFASAAAGQEGIPIEVIYINTSGHPKAQVPGYPGLEFRTGASAVPFDRPYASANGNWAMHADTNATTSGGEVVMVNGQVQVLEFEDVPWLDGSETIGSLGDQVGVNDAGEVTFSVFTSPSSGQNSFLVRGDGSGGLFVEAQEGDLIKGIPGARYGSFLHSALLADDGRVGLVSDGTFGGGITSLTDTIVLLGGFPVVQTGADFPTGGMGNPWLSFVTDETWISGDGNHWLVEGRIATGDFNTDSVVGVDGAIVVQEGQTLPGFSAPVGANGINGARMDRGGGWMVRGENSNGDDWVLFNGDAVAREGDPIYPGAFEFWTDLSFSDTFFTIASNGLGHYVVGGESFTVANMNSVLVLNGVLEIARESMSLDVDGDGSVVDDDTTLGVFRNDAMAFADTGELFFVARMEGLNDGMGFFKMNIDLDVGAGYCTAAVNSTGAGAVMSAFGSSSVSANRLALTAQPVPAGQNGIFYYGPDQANAPFGNGVRCVDAGAVGVFRLPAVVADGNGRLAWPVDLSDPPSASGLVTAGSTWNFQAWYRDPAGGGAFFNLSDGRSITFGM